MIINYIPTNTALKLSEERTDLRMKIHHIFIAYSDQKVLKKTEVLPYNTVIACPCISSLLCDSIHRWMFWIDLGEESEIERVSMDGTNHTTIISTDIVQPTGLAIDYDTLTLFWCDAALDRIESSKLDGSHRAVLLEENIIFHPLSITFFNGSLFWGDWVVGAVYTLRVANPEENGLVRAILGMELSGIKVVSESRQAEGERYGVFILSGTIMGVKHTG